MTTNVYILTKRRAFWRHAGIFGIGVNYAQTFDDVRGRPSESAIVLDQQVTTGELAYLKQNYSRVITVHAG